MARRIREQFIETRHETRRICSESAERIALTREAIRQTDVRLARLYGLIWSDSSEPED